MVLGGVQGPRGSAGCFAGIGRMGYKMRVEYPKPIYEGNVYKRMITPGEMAQKKGAPER